MIQKFLVVGKQVRMSTARPADAQAETETILALSMPLDVYWQAVELIKSINYLQSTHEPNLKVAEVHMAIYKLVAPYAGNDKDRAWLYEQVQGKTSSPT